MRRIEGSGASILISNTADPSRGAFAPEVWNRMSGLPDIRHFKDPPEKERGTARQATQPVLMCASSLRKTRRLPARRPAFCFGAGPRSPGYGPCSFRKSGKPDVRLGACRLRAPRGGLLVGHGRSPAPPERVACSPRPRAPARSTRAGATGSRPSWGTGGYWVYYPRNVVKRVGRIFVNCGFSNSIVMAGLVPAIHVFSY
jgi:hypothetical protein